VEIEKKRKKLEHLEKLQDEILIKDAVFIKSAKYF